MEDNLKYIGIAGLVLSVASLIAKKNNAVRVLAISGIILNLVEIGYSYYIENKENKNQN